MALQYSDLVAAQSGSLSQPEQYTDTATGQVYTRPTTVNTGVTSTNPTAIPADSMGDTQAIQVPGVSTDTSGANATVAGAEQTGKSIQDYLKEVTPPESETQKQYNSLLGDISTMLPELANKPADQLKAEQEANLPQLKQDLAALNSQILTRTAEYSKLQTDIEGKAIPLQFITGQQAQAQRMQASEIGLLQARALGLQGQVAQAQETANRAIDLKYDSLEAILNVKAKQLELIQPILDKEERRFSEALSRQYADQQQQLASERERSKNTLSLAYEQGVNTRFVNNFGEFVRMSDGKVYGDPNQFFADAGVGSFEEAYARGMITDIDIQKILQMNAPTSSGGSSGGGGGGTTTTTTSTVDPNFIGPINPNAQQTSSLPVTEFTKTPSANNIRTWLLSNYHRLAGQPVNEIWGATADYLRANGIDPSKYDKTFWDVFRPGEYDTVGPGSTKTSTSSSGLNYSDF